MIPKSALPILACLTCVAACSPNTPETSRPKIVVTYSVLGAVVQDLVGNAAQISVLIPDGQDPHEFQPSARDIEAINDADLVVSNGLDFEEGLLEALARAEENGVKQFRVGNFISQRVKEGEHNVADPHLWLSPMNFIQALPSLTAAIDDATGLTVNAAKESESLTQIDRDITGMIGTIPSCVMVSGHDELGYFSDRYGCKVVGAIIPSFSTTAEATASQIANLKKLASENDVKAVFTGLGTPPEVSEQLANELGISAVSLSTHYLNGAANYREFMLNLATQIVEALR